MITQQPPERIALLAILLFTLPSPGQSEDRIPLEAFAKPPDVSQVILSPDGKHIAYLQRLAEEGRLGTGIRVINLEKLERKLLGYGHVDDFVVNWIKWANNEHVLLSARFPAVRRGVPTTETRLMSLNIGNGEHRNVLSTSYLSRQDRNPQFQDRIVDLLRSDDDNILLAAWLEASFGSSVIRADITRGRAKTAVRHRANIIDWISDRQERVRIAIYRDGTEYRIQHRAPDGKKWETLWKFESFSDERVMPLGFGGDPDTLYVNAYHDGREAIFRVNLRDPELARELVFADEEYDAAGGLIYSPVKNDVVGTRFSVDGGFTFWDESLKRLQDAVDTALPDSANLIYSLSDNERQYIVLATNDTMPGTYYFGDRDKGALVRFANRYEGIDERHLSEKNLISYKARDGLEIEGYITIPKNVERGPYPAIIFPHGGPISFDDGGFDYWTQYFASRGYAVLQMNFRGSSGYGHEFMSSGLKGWGLDMQNDVEDGTRWLIAEGIADPEHICVVGGSYGGYAALMEAARNPDLYNCAISFAGVTDVAYLVSSNRRYTSYEIVREQVGSDFGELRERSPLHLAEQIDIPVLLGHGTKDRRVRVAHSRRLHKKLSKAGKSVTYVEFEDGDHFLSNEEHRLSFFRAMEAFLDAHM